MLKKFLFLSAVIAIFIVTNATAITQQTFKKNTVFTDLGEQYKWAAEAINALTEKGVLVGMTESTFAPDILVTKEQFAKMLVLALSLEVSKEPSQTFQDVEPNRWSFTYVESIKDFMPQEANVPINQFLPDKAYLREEVAATIVKAMGWNEYNIFNKDVLNQTFSDSIEVSESVKGLVGVAVERGILRGDGDRIRPKDTVTRAEAAVFIYRALLIKEGKGETTFLTQTPIVGESQVTLEQAKKWAQSKEAHERFINIADFYWEYGKKTGIRPEVLYAQAAKETNYGKYTGKVKPEQNNWAGIKTATATGDQPEDHETFASLEDGVRAHFNHMAAYVGVSPVGETHARYQSVSKLAWAGSVKYVEELGNKWAPEHTYGYNIVTNYLAPMKEIKAD